MLARPYHLSYPFVFAHDGELLMIPETSAARRVELYRAFDVPGSWERQAVLLDSIDAADATVLSHDGRLWLFAAVAAQDASCSTSCICSGPTRRGARGIPIR